MDELSLFDLPSHSTVAEAERILDRVLAGASGDDVETETIELKVDPVVLAARFPETTSTRDPEDERDRLTAYAAACLANHEGGLVLLGVRDDESGPDALIGSDVDCEALRLRIMELTHPSLLVAVHPVVRNGSRVVAIVVPRNATAEPHAVTMSANGGQKRPRRVGATCHDMAAVAEMVSWANGRSEYDWSAAPSAFGREAARPGALEAARDYLRASGEPGRSKLADADDEEIIGRLGLSTSGTLNNAGALLLCAGEWPTIQYGYRDGGGVPASHRAGGEGGRSLLEDIQRIESVIQAQNRLVPLPSSGSLAVGSVPALPQAAIREAVVNALMHRDWTMHEPVVIDQQHDQVVVFSPGGLMEGLSVDRLLTAPSRPRNRVLANALRSLRLAEGEGTGIDKMFISMVALGHRPPTVEERDGGIRVTLVGGVPVPEVMRAYQEMPAWMVDSARTAVALHLLRSRPSFTIGDLDAVLHEGETALRPFLDRACDADVLRRTANPRPGGDAAWRLSDGVRGALGPILPYYSRPIEESIRLVTDLAREQGSVRNQDVQDLLGVAQPRASQILRRAVDEGLISLAPGAQPTGRSTRYVVV